jgi:hypothetical protein
MIINLLNSKRKGDNNDLQKKKLPKRKKIKKKLNIKRKKKK